MCQQNLNNENINHNIQDANNLLVNVPAKAFGVRYGNKNDIFRFLSTECGIYLPHKNHVTILHLRDLAAGRRRIIKNSEVKVIDVPYFEGLAVVDMLRFSKDFPIVNEALPLELKEYDKLPRSYIANIIYTLVGEPFKLWI